MIDTRGGVDCWAPERGAKVGQLLGLGSRSLWGDGNVVVAADATAVDILKGDERMGKDGYMNRRISCRQYVQCLGEPCRTFEVLTAGPEAGRYKRYKLSGGI